MKILKIFLFFSALFAILVGVLLKMNLLFGGGTLITFGFFGVFLYYTAKTIKDFVKNRNNKFNIILQIGIVLTTIILYSKYQFFLFGDYPGLVIIPCFILMVLVYFIKGNDKNVKLTSVFIIYIILFIPLFCFDFWGSPRRYIPQEWINRYDVEDGIGIELPYEFEYIETEQLSIKAHKLKNEGIYNSAITIYHEALKIEPENPRLFFDLSEAYAKSNRLETAITVLDAAIKLDSTNAAFYNNRGLLHYKLKEKNQAIANYLKAIQLDSTQLSLYLNLAMAYYYEDKFILACEAIDKAEKLGFNIKSNKYLNKIKKRYCITAIKNDY